MKPRSAKTVTPRNPPESINEIIAALPDMGVPFWLGIFLLFISLVVLFVGASTFSHDVMALSKTKKELAHLLQQSSKESENNLKKYQRYEFKVDATTVSDHKYGYTFKAITLSRISEVYQREQYTYRDKETGKDKVGYRNVWETEDYDILHDPEFVDLSGFRLNTDYLEEKSLGIPSLLPENHPDLREYRQVLKDGYLYFYPFDRKKDIPHHGDFRISYWGAKKQAVTAIAKIQGGLLEPYVFSSHHHFIKTGKHSVTGFLKDVQSSTRSSFVLPLIVGVVLLILGLIITYGGYLGRPILGEDLVVLIRPAWTLGLPVLLLGFAKGYFT